MSSILTSNIWRGSKRVSKSNTHRLYPDEESVASMKIHGYGESEPIRENFYPHMSSALKYHDGLDHHSAEAHHVAHGGPSGHLAAGTISDNERVCGSDPNPYIGNVRHYGAHESDVDKHISASINPGMANVMNMYQAGGSSVVKCADTPYKAGHGDASRHYAAAEKYRARENFSSRPIRNMVRERMSHRPTETSTEKMAHVGRFAPAKKERFSSRCGI